MNNNKTIRIGIVIVAAIAAMMLIGPNLTYMQSYATGSHGKSKAAFSDVRSSIIHKSANTQQHMDSEDLCFRTADCKNSNVGQQIKGNDNSITGFADQSTNLPQNQNQNQNQNQTSPSSNGNTPSSTPVSVLILPFCSNIQFQNATGAGDTQTATTTCTFTSTITGDNNSVQQGAIIPISAITLKTGTCPTGTVAGTVHIPGRADVNVCVDLAALGVT
jgi:hypothetical protein